MSKFISFVPIRSAALAGVALSALAAITAPSAHAALPVPTACLADAQGANDEPGQKDLTRFCVGDGTAAPYELHTLVNWDDIELSGNNTSDICTLYDNDDNGYVDIAVCTTLAAAPLAGNPAVLSELRLYRCQDDRPDRCTNSTLVGGVYDTVCESAKQKTDPFSPAAANGPGDFYPDDVEILCAVDLDDFGPGGTGAVLVDACSYPSQEPNSDPSDCVATAQCASDAECDDGNVCTTDNCDHQGFCQHRPRKGNVTCDDGLFCNGPDSCNASGLCQPGAGRDCTDDVSCTIDTCDELANQCVNQPQNSLCNDSQYCNGVETCSAQNGCVAGTPINCSDGVSCTTDACNEATDSCVRTPSNALCNNNLFCDGVETCDAQLGCRPGTTVNCDDGVSCTTDACSEAQDTCTHAPSNASCSNGIFCDGTEVCDPEEGCGPGTPPNCNDGVSCTDDSCNEVADKCDHLPDNDACDDGLFCDGNETCDPAEGCEDGVDPCTLDQVCDEPDDECVECLTNADCDDQDFCNGAETCNPQTGTCVGGASVDCDDGVSCTSDSCNEATESCQNVPNDALCSDGQHCTGVETCDAQSGCQDGANPVCDDGVACTVDQCDEAADSCTFTPSNDLCSNGSFCDGSETCDPTLGCQDSPDPDCDDAIDCTADSCNEASDRCDHVADASTCQDGLFCNGVEVCSLQVGCTAGAPVVCTDGFTCSANICNEDLDKCEFDFSPCVCGDGEVTGVEVCDPPAAAGTYEDCNNTIDDDGDGEIDCRDKDCKPNAREPLCDEGCILDQVCTKFIRDPAIIKFAEDEGLDEFYIHGRILMDTVPDPTTEGLAFQLSTEASPVYRASLGWGELKGPAGGRKFQFKDPYARYLGEDSVAGGIALARVKFRLFRGVPHLVFTLRAFGDFSEANHWLMTSEITVGREVGFLQAEWEAVRGGWKLHQTDF